MGLKCGMSVGWQMPFGGRREQNTWSPLLQLVIIFFLRFDDMTEPSRTPQLSEPKYGFNDYVERLNGRAAMIGFVAAIVLELVTGHGVLGWLGLR